MSETPYTRVLMPTDLEPWNETAWVHAVRLALLAHGGADLVHVHVPGVEPRPSPLPSVRELVVRWGLLDPGAGVESFHHLSARVRLHLVPSLDLVEPVLHLLDGVKPDLLVLPTHARTALDRLRVASAAEVLAREAACPALFVPFDARPFVDPDTGAVMLRRVVVAVGAMADARAAVAEAMRLVRSFHGGPTELVLVHVGDRSTVPALLLEEDDARWSWRFDLRGGAVPQEIVRAAFAHDADLVVMATQGHDSLADWLVGSRTEIVARHAPCPVLAVPLPPPEG